MKGISVIIIFVLITTVVLGQKPSINKLDIKTISNDKMEDFVDSLKKKITSDTANFDRNDLIHNGVFTRNIKPYSSLYCIDDKYVYKLDIIDGKGVLEFVNQYLDVKKVGAIIIMNPEDSQRLYGSHGTLGLIFIYIRKGTVYNPDIAGLKRKAKRDGGDNFWQKKPNEIILRN
ncbi:hypothetical protein [Pedobacter frigiditerrae]|uniref:hypothetical protein n=1 Tax=Pedobacter frigiditerrae TaxID=2530452 RepID=UPI00292D0992|nr:hypothetical protein [Pedobacter frigiditerrae]